MVLRGSTEIASIPQEPGALAAWFAEGVRAELAALEKIGGSQIYEVHSGKLIQTH
jgi:hypothetical protein